MSASKSKTSSLSQRTEGKSTSDAKSTRGSKYHFNSIWSLWYCAVILTFTTYLVFVAYKRFKMYASLPWPDDERPYIELNAHVGLVGSAVVVMPFFIVASLMKVGNLANDGGKLGSSLSACGRDAPAVLPPTVGTIRNLWIHGFPTAPFLHLVAAFCLFLPKVLMDGTLIKAGFMAQDNIWRTDMDVFMLHNDAFFSKRENMSLVDQINLPIESFPESLTDDTSGLSSRMSKRNVEINWKPGFSQQPERVLPSTEFFFKRKPIEKMGHRKSTEDYYAWKPFSPELIYYFMALVVFAVRYPAVFWNTNKLFSFLFSAQLLINGVQTLLTLMSFSILYKMLVNSNDTDLVDVRSYLLNPVASLVSVALAVMVVSVSSIALYIYGYQRFCHFVFRSKQRFHISYDKDPNIVKPHTSLICAMVTLIGLALTYGPILWDMTTVYKRSLNVVVLSSIIGTICYLFQWIILWIFLSVKNSWTFKLRVTVARAFVSSARSIKLVNDVEMVQPHEVPEESALLIVGKGKAYAVQDDYPQREILDVVQRVKEEKKGKGNENDVYWLRPSSSKGHKQKIKNSQQKVTFSDTVRREIYSTRNGDQHAYHGGLRMTESDDDGDYAILKAGSPGDDSDNTSDSSNREELENPRYVDRRQILAYREANQRIQDMSPPSPILVAPDYEETDVDENSPTQISRRQLLMESQGPMTPRSNRSNDSGMPPENQSQRSDSIASTASTNTPAENSEESGVHSVIMETYRNRSSSVDDLSQYPPGSSQPPTHPSFPNFSRPALMNINSVYGYCKGGTGGGQYKIIYPSAETTLAIKRQRNLTHEVKPPFDSIYGTRKLSSFTDTVRQDARRNFDLGLPNSHSNSSGYQSSSANNSSGSNSAGNSPIPPHPLAPISEHPMIHSNSYDFSNTKPYGRLMPTVDQYGHRMPPTGSAKFTQMPLSPPIPQGAQICNPGLENLKNEIYGRSGSAQSYHSPGKPLFSQMKGLPINRSASLRLPANQHPRKQYTTTLPHLLPKESYYNTNV